VQNLFPGKSKVVTVPTTAFLFGSEFEGNSNKVAKEMGVSTRSKVKLTACSDVEDQSSCGSVHSVKRKVKRSGKASNSIIGEQRKKHSEKAVSEAAGAKQLDPMAVVLETTEKGKCNRDYGKKDQCRVNKAYYTFEEMVKKLAKDGGKDAEREAETFLVTYNIAKSRDPNVLDKLNETIDSFIAQNRALEKPTQPQVQSKQPSAQPESK
jgi:hypothetical protein